MSTEESQPSTGHAEQAYEALRALNHDTLNARLPAPVVYDVLGNLKGIGHLLPQALNQLASGLGRSLDEYDVREDDGGDPVQNIAAATDHLTRAAHLADQLGEELEKAQTVLSGQGYRTDAI